jgi:hypothetical protein
MKENFKRCNLGMINSTDPAFLSINTYSFIICIDIHVSNGIIFL